jgi:two-component system response regulator MprA
MIANVSDNPILLVDDDPAILCALTRGLRIEGYVVVPAQDSSSALAAARVQRPSAVILDRMLPDQDGLKTCQQLRDLGDFPILMLTARDAIDDRVVGLDCGADDYLVKPFALAELLARLRAILRRVPTGTSERLRFADVTLDLSSHRVWRGGRRIELRTREFELLEFFLRNPDRVLPRGLIFEHVWGFDFLGDSNIIDVTIKNLRQKLDAEGEPRLIQTVRRVGYALKLE